MGADKFLSPYLRDKFCVNSKMRTNDENAITLVAVVAVYNLPFGCLVLNALLAKTCVSHPYNTLFLFLDCQ